VELLVSQDSNTPLLDRIRTPADLQRLHEAGARAVLVGESLMRAPDIGAALDALRGIA